RLIVDAAQQDVLKRHPLSRAQRNRLYGVEQLRDVPLARDRHNALANNIIARVERERQLGSHGFLREGFDPREYAGSRDGHPRLRNADAIDQHTHALHEGVVVQKRFTHTHEDEVDAVLAHFDAMSIEHCGDLPGDLPGSQVAANPQLGRQAELAVDGAADLAGNADRRPPESLLRERAPVALVDLAELARHRFRGIDAIARLLN